MLSVCDAGHGGRAKELTRVGIASGAGKTARSLSRHVKENRMLVVTSACAIVLAIVMVGISRIYLGVHYASDVLGGFCASTIWLVLYAKVIAPALGLIE